MISSLEWHRPGISPREQIQNIAAKDEEKKMPSTMANAIKRVPNEYDARSNHLRHQSAFRLTDVMVSMAPNRVCSSSSSTMSSCRNRAYVSAWMFSLSYRYESMG